MSDSEDKAARAEEEDDCDVGYKKPPKRTQFKPGQSGNPRGRPKGTKNLKTDLAEALAEKVVIREGDAPRQVSKQRALIMSQLNRAIKGDARSATLITSLMMRVLGADEDVVDISEVLHEDDLAIVEAFKARVQRKLRNEEPDDGSSVDAEGDPS